MLQTTPFLLFDGNCAEVMSFYQKCLGGDLTLTKLGDTLMKDQFPQETQGRIIYAHLKNDTIDFSATDWMASPTLEPMPGNTFSIYLTGGNYAELKAAFDKLSLGADRDTRTYIPLNEIPFGIYDNLRTIIKFRGFSGAIIKLKNRRGFKLAY